MTPIYSVIKRKLKNIIPRKDVFQNQTVDYTFSIGKLKFTVDKSDQGGTQYLNKIAYEEINDPLYFEIFEKFNPSLIVDVGANYGITGVNLSQKFPNAHILLIEADKRLNKYIELNFKQNALSNHVIVNAVCGDKKTKKHSFFLNPKNSQDNRVIAPSPQWKECSIPSITLDEVLLDATLDTRFVFFKFDTQGYEYHILKGMNNFINSHFNWIIKMEFAPFLLIPHSTDPVYFLMSLIERFDVAELSSRTKFKGDSLKDLLANKLTLDEVGDFVSYIQSLNADDKGWCDLLVLPKN